MYLVIIGKRKVAGHKLIATSRITYRLVAHYLSSGCTFQSIKRTKTGGRHCLAVQGWRTPNTRSRRVNFLTGYRTRDLCLSAATPNHLSYVYHSWSPRRLYKNTYHNHLCNPVTERSQTTSRIMRNTNCLWLQTK
uniref:Uncharacterized protein n=1 Tax=Hyaloperonospora arabidopsidis (strain Emoy2) TaxID=559515 RepID=M4C376_HYAAE